LGSEFAAEINTPHYCKTQTKGHVVSILAGGKNSQIPESQNKNFTPEKPYTVACYYQTHTISLSKVFPSFVSLMSPDPPTSLHSKLTNIQNQTCSKETIACDAHFATALLCEKKDDVHKANALSPPLPSHSVR
jgi:hypothetical protein